MKYQRKNLVSEQIGDELVLLNHETSHLIKLNQTASFVWNLLKKPLSSKEITDKILLNHTEVDRQDIKNLLKTLTHEKIVELK